MRDLVLKLNAKTFHEVHRHCERVVPGQTAGISKPIPNENRRMKTYMPC